MRLDLARRYKRWRHGRGFGIHSPFAYDFITTTLRERLPYYAYSKLDALAAEKQQGASVQRRLRLIFRIAVRFNPTTAAIIGVRNASLQKVALKELRRDINLKSSLDKADLVIVNEDLSPGLVLREGLVYIFPDSRCGGATVCETLWQSMPYGMRFDNSKGFSIIVANPKLPRQQFDVRF